MHTQGDWLAAAALTACVGHHCTLPPTPQRVSSRVPPAPKPRPQASSELSPLLFFFKGTLLVTRGEGTHRAPRLEGSGI